MDAYLFDEPLVLLGEDGAPFFEKERDVAFYAEGKVWVNNHAHVLRCGHQVLPRFLARVLNVVDYTTFVDGATRDKLTQQKMGAIPIQLPPHEEQEQITIFLDTADRRIQRAIRAKQRLIKLLDEQRQVIIQRAVTRGLDPKVPLKPSGLNWLDDVPAHWELVRLKRLFHEVDVRTKTGGEELLSLRMHRGLVPHNEVSSKPIGPDALIGFRKVEPQQIVMNRMRASMGMFAVAERPGLVSPDYAVFDTREPLVPDYYLMLFKTPMMGGVFRAESKGLGTGSSGFLRLYSDRFGQIAVPFPPLPEQSEIVAHVKRATSEIDQAIEAANREIRLLREYRTRLIADVVTGTIDVRAAAEGLPSPEEEPEALDPVDLDIVEDELEDEDAEEVAEEVDT